MGQRIYEETRNLEWNLQVIPGEYYIDSGKNVKERQRGRKRESTYSARVLAERKRERKAKKRKKFFCCAGLLLLFAILLPKAGRIWSERSQSGDIEKFLRDQKAGKAENFDGNAYPEALLEMLEKNEETYEFVTEYPNRADYMGKEIDIAKECQGQEVPLLMQWDLRWGYDNYGAEMIGVAGCGPTCMTMAYVHLTGDTSMNPRKMAEYAYENGFYTEAGTSWNFFTEGAADLGLYGNEIPLGEGQMKGVLDNGGVIVCSMRPGDFTTTGHFILIRGYDENGFYVNDPNSRKNSERQWDFETLSPQIKCLWGMN